MAYSINSTTVINNSIELNNIASVDTTTAVSTTEAITTSTNIASGTTIRASKDAQVARIGATNLLVMTFGIVQFGSISLYYEAYISNSADSGLVSIVRYRNGSNSTIATQTITATSYTASNSIQSVLPGDRFEFYVRGGTSSTCYIRNVRLRTNTSTVYIPASTGDYFEYVLAQ